MEQNQDLKVDIRSSELLGWKLGFCVFGGIAAIEAPRTIRELRRRGAEVQVWASEKALDFVGRTSLEWASGRKVLVETSGMAQHVATECQGVVVYPATANALSQLTHGSCSDGVATFLQSALGLKLPLVLFPAMHDSLAESPFVLENLAALEKLPWVKTQIGRLEEGKHKVPLAEDAGLLISHSLNRIARNWNGVGLGECTVTGGGTQSRLDPVRCFTNLSSGRLGRSLAKSLFARGHRVKFLRAQCSFEMPGLDELEVQDVPQFEELKGVLEKLELHQGDGFFHMAAVSDYLVKDQSQTKISSQSSTLSLHLEGAPKLLQLPKVLHSGAFRFAGKLTSGSESEGLAVAQSFLSSSGFAACLWNSSDSLGIPESDHAGILVTRRKGAAKESLTSPSGDPGQTFGPWEMERVKGKDALAEKISELYARAVGNSEVAGKGMA